MNRWLAITTFIALGIAVPAAAAPVVCGAKFVAVDLPPSDVERQAGMERTIRTINLDHVFSLESIKYHTRAAPRYMFKIKTPNGKIAGYWISREAYNQLSQCLLK